MENDNLMFGVTPEDKEPITLMERHAIVDLPENAVEIEMRVTVFKDGGLVDAWKTLSQEDIRKAFNEADEIGYIGPDDVFAITEKGLKALNEASGN